jgi:hypothetical protein
MNNEQPITWKGQSGTSYQYFLTCTVSEIGTVPWFDRSGNYIFAKETTPGHWDAIYIGECDSFSVRLTTSHEKLPCARKHGATHILTHLNPHEFFHRLAEETDLRAANPDAPCNLQ